MKTGLVVGAVLTAGAAAIYALGFLVHAGGGKLFSSGGGRWTTVHQHRAYEPQVGSVIPWLIVTGAGFIGLVLLFVFGIAALVTRRRSLG